MFRVPESSRFNSLLRFLLFLLTLLLLTLFLFWRLRLGLLASLRNRSGFGRWSALLLALRRRSRLVLRLLRRMVRLGTVWFRTVRSHSRGIKLQKTAAKNGRASSFKACSV